MRRGVLVILIVLACSMVGRWAERSIAAERLSQELRVIVDGRRRLTLTPVSVHGSAIPSPTVWLRLPKNGTTTILRGRIVAERGRARSSPVVSEDARARFFAAPKEVASNPQVDAILVGPSNRRVKLRARSRSEWYEEGDFCAGWEVTHIDVDGVLLTNAGRPNQRMLRLQR